VTTLVEFRKDESEKKSFIHELIYRDQTSPVVFILFINIICKAS